MTDSRASRYSRIRYSLAIAEIAWMLALLFAFCRAGWSASLARALGGNGFAGRAAYLAVAFVLYYVASFPLTFYRSYLLERRYSLSKETLAGWFADQAKAGGVAYCVSLALLFVFYWSLARFPGDWWLPVSLIWFCFNVLLARLAPVLIVPLFFKYTPVTDEKLRSRILILAQRMKVKVIGVFEINMSRTTVKGNAGLIGWGKSRRVVLGDTLKERYSPDEIEVILAHEFAHQKLRHLPALLLLNSLAATACFYLIFATSPWMLGAFGLAGLGETASIPLVASYFVLFGIVTQPLLNFISRRMERSADIAAVEATGMPDAFISSMEKLASQNLSDPAPGRVVKFFFYDHPPVAERIALARSMACRGCS